MLRSNTDFRYMARVFAEAAALEGFYRCDAAQLAACFRSLRATIEAHAAVQRMATSVVALHVVASTVDYYITKYAAKPMEQLQNLVAQYALGLRRLEEEERQDSAAAARKGSHEDAKARGRRGSSAGCMLPSIATPPYATSPPENHARGCLSNP